MYQERWVTWKTAFRKDKQSFLVGQVLCTTNDYNARVVKTVRRPVWTRFCYPAEMSSFEQTSRALNVQNILGRTYEGDEEDEAAAQGTKKEEDKKDPKDVQHIMGRHKEDPENEAEGEDETST